MFTACHRQLFQLYPPLLLTASLILPIVFGHVSILNLNFSLFIDHHSTDTGVVTLISFSSVGSFFPIPYSLYGFGGQSDTSLFIIQW